MGLGYLKPDMELVKLIGGGSYGDVYEAIIVREDAQKSKVAAKIILKQAEDIEIEIQNEIKFLKSCKHTNIVSFFGTIVERGKLIIIMEYAECGSLSNLLHGKDWEKRNANDVARINWMLQLANGMAYLHDQNIVHRDLKPDNLVLTDKYKTLKICDFGLVKQLASNNTDFRGTVKYMAPEVSNGAGKYTAKCDVFSFGIILWEVMSNKKPFYELEHMVLIAQQMKINEGKRPNLADVQPYENINHIKSLIKKCWKKNEIDRPTIQHVAFILGIDRHTVDPNKIKSIKPLPLARDVDFQ